MKVISKPKPEEKVVAPVGEKATAEALYKSLVERAEACVNHLCGCSSCGHSGC
jgi:hypothetical protein